MSKLLKDSKIIILTLKLTENGDVMQARSQGGYVGLSPLLTKLSSPSDEKNSRHGEVGEEKEWEKPSVSPSKANSWL